MASESEMIDFHSGSYFSTILEVSQSWDDIRRIYNYEETFSTLLYEKFLELEPNAIDYFHFSNNKKNSENEEEKETCCSENSSKYGDYYEHPLFYEHCLSFVKMLDLVIHLLGPDVELVEEILLDLGGKNLDRGVMQETYKPFGNALLYSIQELLSSIPNTTRRASAPSSSTTSSSLSSNTLWSESKRSSWNAVYNYMSTLLTEGANKCQTLKLNPKKSRRHSCFM